jgi:hypothetical protein
MEYKGFEIVPVRSVCADWKLNKEGCVVPVRPSEASITHYQIVDNGKNWIAEDTIELCKQTIDSFLTKNGLQINITE